MREILYLGLSQLDKLLYGIQKPGRYIGCEIGVKSKDIEVLKSFPDMVLIVLAFPDIYEIGMSNLGLNILYEIVNRREDFSAERVFSPWLDFEERLRREKVKLFSLENRIFIDCFDVIGFNVQHEMLYTNVLNILDLGGIELCWKDRSNVRFPLVCAGGPSVVNPQPLSKFMDFMVIGDGEEIIIEILERVKLYKKSGREKTWFLSEVSKLDGVYVPRFYRFYYYDDGKIEKFLPQKRIKKSVVRDLDQFEIVKSPIIPNIKPVHDRFVVEIMRGCSRGCRFCQAGIIYRPVRRRKLDYLIEQSIRGLANTGYDEISFMSLSVSDYKGLDELVESVVKNCDLENISVSLPSMRLDSFSIRLAELIKAGRRTGLTFAPEAGSQRMRDIINKDISEDEMMECIKVAFQKGWEKIKLYFMIGLPFEDESDIKEILRLMEKVLYNARRFLPRSKWARFNLNVSINGFCPKPFTPFQWVAQDSVESLRSKFDYILTNLPGKKVNVSWTSPEKTKVECFLSRGNEFTGDVIRKAWESGAKFDNWTDLFDYSKWENACNNAGVSMDFFTTRVISSEEILPWDVIDIGISKEFLLKEYEKSKELSRKRDKV